MTLHWSSLREECPLAIQLIEKRTGFIYDPAYGTMIKDNKQLTYAHLEDFFDNHGWFMSVYPMQFPGWNGIITDTSGKKVFDDYQEFSEVRSRMHAKSLLAGITIKYFEEMVKTMMDIPKGHTQLTSVHVMSHALSKPIEQILLSDINLDGQGLAKMADLCILIRDDKAKVMKQRYDKLPYRDMVFPAKYIFR